MTGEALSVESALGLLEATEPDEATPEPIVDDVADAGGPTPDEAGEAEEPIAAETEDEGEAGEPPIAPPHSWDAEAKALFEELPREAQQVIAARERDRDAAVTRATQEAAETRKRAESEVQGIAQLRDATSAVLAKAAQTFKGRWDNVDWAGWAQTNPADYVAGKAMYDAEMAELGRLEAVNREQAAIAQRAFQAQKMELIRTEAPDLVDPKEGPGRVKQLESFLESNGIPRDIFHTLDAFTIGLAYDGMRFRQAKATAPKVQPAAARPALRPTGAAVAPSPKRAAQEAMSRFTRSGSLEDALALMNSRN